MSKIKPALTRAIRREFACGRSLQFAQPRSVPQHTCRLEFASSLLSLNWSFVRPAGRGSFAPHDLHAEQCCAYARGDGAWRAQGTREHRDGDGGYSTSADLPRRVDAGCGVLKACRFTSVTHSERAHDVGDKGLECLSAR
jgi:hypothetical protein